MVYEDFCTPYDGEEAFVFVSYSHVHFEKVQTVIRLLNRQGIRVWYDPGIKFGDKWKDSIDERLKTCAVFLCFVANGIEQRIEVIREISEAIKRSENNECKVLFIFLERMALNLLEEQNGTEGKKLKEWMDMHQRILYTGITDQFISQILASDVFPGQVYDNKIRADFGLTNPRDNSRNLSEIKEALHLDMNYLLQNEYVYETEFPEQHGNIYRVLPHQVYPSAVALLSVDDNWCPPAFYRDPDFQKHGFVAENYGKVPMDKEEFPKGNSFTEKRKKIAERDFYRSLLHYRQVVLNRASLFNCEFFHELYSSENLKDEQKKEDYESFASLVSNGTLLIYLYKETHPTDDVNFETNYLQDWRLFCKDRKIYCLKMDWDNADNNNAMTKMYLSDPFQRFYLMSGEDRAFLEGAAAIMELPDDCINEFIGRWQYIQSEFAKRNRKTVRTYNRKEIYQYFILRKPEQGMPSSTCGMVDYSPENYSSEIKRLIDVKYCSNLPNAFGIRMLYPEEDQLGEYIHEYEMGYQNRRKISTDEITCAIGQFSANTFITGNVYALDPSEYLSLSDICKFRNLQSWKEYIRTVDNGRERAHLNEVDFYDIEFVWKKYQHWVDDLRELTTDHIPDEHWLQKEAAVSIIFKLGIGRITAVYHSDGTVVYRPERFCDGQEMPAYAESLMKRTGSVSISYVLTDILSCDGEMSSILTELVLFEGVSSEPLSAVSRSILEYYKKNRNARMVYFRHAAD